MIGLDPGRVVTGAPHGTLRGFTMGCRCPWCTAARRATTVGCAVNAPMTTEHDPARPLRFRPLRLPLGDVALPGYPRDHEQICPTCRGGAR